VQHVSIKLINWIIDYMMELNVHVE
jgi:hypothetical protein